MTIRINASRNSTAFIATTGFCILASVAVLVVTSAYRNRRKGERKNDNHVSSSDRRLGESTSDADKNAIAAGNRPTGRRIFVSIASYRDPDTPNTLRDLFENARHPKRIFAGVLWQIAEGQDEFLQIPEGYRDQVRGIITPAERSKGACWARHRIQTELYGGEEYYLMIDSHSRFADGWDDRIVDMLESCPSKKPALSTYPCYFTPPRNLGESHLPALKAGDFTEDGILLLATTSLGKPDLRSPPKPGAFMGANCFFSHGSVVSDVPYDPYLYFHGEEISMSVRLWTKGYDLFTPNDVLLYHDYSPTDDTDRPRHWDDDTEWWKKNLRSFERVRYLLAGEQPKDDTALAEIDKYGLGTARSVEDFERFADLSFSSRSVGERAKQGAFPDHFPCKDQEEVEKGQKNFHSATAELDAAKSKAQLLEKRQQEIEAENTGLQAEKESSLQVVNDRNQRSPPQCTSAQLETISQMLPNRTTINLESRCPQATWLRDWDIGVDDPQQNTQTDAVALIFGCNKGMDAVHALQWLSHNAVITIDAWKHAMQQQGDRPISVSICAQDMVSSKPKEAISSMRPAQVHCVEAMPSTYQRLAKANDAVGWKDQLHIHHYAMASEDGGTLLFPNSTMVGREDLGLFDCGATPNEERMLGATCVPVPQSSMDGFVKRHLDDQASRTSSGSGGLPRNDRIIPFVSIDVEGFDWPVLKGGAQTLSRVKYLEFEYHSVGAWRRISLHYVVMDYLFDRFDMVCYWAGREGRLWRLTHCWRDLYDTAKTWSNIACVSQTLSPSLATKMERQFLNTLELNKAPEAA